MRDTLKKKLWTYLAESNPELVISLQESQSVDSYLEDQLDGIQGIQDEMLEQQQPAYIIEEACLNTLTQSMGPSRFLLLKSILEEEFPETHLQLEQAGILAYETLNLMGECREIFEHFGLTEDNQDDRMLRNAITGQISDYLNEATENMDE